MSPTVHALDRARVSQNESHRPGRSEVEAAFRTIIRWTGDNPERDGLHETPARVTRAFEEFFAGYAQDPVEILEKTFEEIEGYDEMIVLRGIRFESHCEHHMAPIIGQAWVAYIPNGRVVGISKLARVVDVYAKRLQIQEKMTAQIANTINDVLETAGCRRHYQGGASLHDHARRPQTGHRSRDQPHAGLLSRQRADAAGIPGNGDVQRSARKHGRSASPARTVRICRKGIAPAEFTGATLLGHVGDEEVLLVRSGAEIFAIDAHCSHYHGPLAEGLVTGEDIRCPWHHACFDLRTGEATRAPALAPLAVLEGRAAKTVASSFAKSVEQPRPQRRRALVDAPGQIVIVGGGAAGFAAAEMLRRQDYRGSIVMLSNEAAAPVDRPNLSKDYLAGSAPEDWLPLRPDDFYAEAKIDLRLNTEVTSIDTKARQVVTAGGEIIPYDRLLLATGAEPVRLPIPGADQPHVHVLRSLADCRAHHRALPMARAARS